MCSARLRYLTRARTSTLSVRLFHRGREVDQMPRLDVLRLVQVPLQAEYESEVGCEPLLEPIYGNGALSKSIDSSCYLFLCIKWHGTFSHWKDAILRGDSSPNLPATALRKVDLDGADCDVTKESFGFWSDWLYHLNTNSHHVQVPSPCVPRSQPR